MSSRAQRRALDCKRSIGLGRAWRQPRTGRPRRRLPTRLPACCPARPTRPRVAASASASPAAVTGRCSFTSARSGASTRRRGCAGSTGSRASLAARSRRRTRPGMGPARLRGRRGDELHRGGGGTGAKPRRSIDISAVLRGTLGPGSIAERAAAAYREHLFGRATLQDLPAEGEGGRSSSSTPPASRAGPCGASPGPTWRTGASAGSPTPRSSSRARSQPRPPFPPCSPLTLDLSEEKWITEPGNHLTDGDYRRRGGALRRRRLRQSRARGGVETVPHDPDLRRRREPGLRRRPGQRPGPGTSSGCWA